MLAPAYFSPNYKCFDQLLQTVKNKTTVLIFVFRVLTNINSTTDFCTLCKRVSRFSVEKFSFHSAEKFRRGTRLCFRKFRVSKNFMPKRGISRFSIENLLSHSTEKLRRGTLLICFWKCPVAKKFMDKRGGIKIFRRSFCLTVPKYFIGEHFGVSEKFFYRKLSCIGGGGGHHGFVEFFLSHRTETKSFVKEHFCFPEIFWYRKNLWIRGGLSRFSFEIFMSHSAENLRKGILLFLRKFLASKSFTDEKGGITFFRRKFFVSLCRKTSYRNPLVFH